MRRMVLTGLREMAMFEEPKPTLKRDTDVLLKIECVGVCGSDIHYYTTGRIGSQVVEYPYPVGHECAATVEEVGAAVTDLQPGDKVAVDPAAWCNECDQCRKGRYHTCRNLVFMGCPGQIDGCLGDYYVMPAASCFKVKPETSFELAALCEPLSIGIYAVKLAQLPKDAKIGILGLGPIGLSILVAARAVGISEIYVTEPIDERRNLALDNGATFGVNPHVVDAVQGILGMEPQKLDAVFECCGEQSAIDEGCRLLTPGGKLMIVGIPEVDRISFSPDIARRNELCFQHVRRQNECVEDAVRLVEEGKIDVSFMITHRFSLEDCKEAFDLVTGYEDGVVKAMVNL